MKNTALCVLLCLAMVLLTACSAPADDSQSAAGAKQPPAVDLDLSALSGTVVYSQVNHMVTDPSSWLGKTIRMAGYYSAYEDTARGVVYHACVIPDAMACCAQGIEFVCAGERTWPDEYPAEGTDITVTGRFASYEEDGLVYLHLVDADVQLNPEA